jgi:hypothetical protein
MPFQGERGQELAESGRSQSLRRLARARQALWNARGARPNPGRRSVGPTGQRSSAWGKAQRRPRKRSPPERAGRRSAGSAVAAGALIPADLRPASRGTMHPRGVALLCPGLHSHALSGRKRAGTRGVELLPEFPAPRARPASTMERSRSADQSRPEACRPKGPKELSLGQSAAAPQETEPPREGRPKVCGKRSRCGRIDSCRPSACFAGDDASPGRRSALPRAVFPCPFRAKAGRNSRSRTAPGVPGVWRTPGTRYKLRLAVYPQEVCPGVLLPLW